MEGAAEGVCSVSTASGRAHTAAWAPGGLSQLQAAGQGSSALGAAHVLAPFKAWFPTAQGPTETPFEGGSFELSINVPEQYPLVPPTVRFKTKIFHPNVHFRVSCRAHWKSAHTTTHAACEAAKSISKGGLSGRKPECSVLTVGLPQQAKQSSLGSA